MNSISEGDWPIKTLGQVATVVNGGTPKSKVSEYWGGSIQWLTPKDMGNMDGREINETPRTITKSGLDKSSARLIPANSVILSTRAPIGHLAINTEPMAFNQGCRGLVPKEGLDHVFLYYFLLANRALLQELGTGTTFNELSANNLKSVPIILPPLREQRRIVAVLDEAFDSLDRARAHVEANLQNARELFSTGIETALGEVGGKSITLAKLIEDGWILSHLDGNHGSKYPRKDEFVPEGVPYISANCIVGNSIDMSQCKYLTPSRADTLRKGVAQDRDVIFAHNATVGPVVLLSTDKPRVILSTSLTYYRCNEKKLRPDFLVYEMRSVGFKRQYEAVMVQATRSQVPITMQRKFLHIVPSMENQIRIAEFGKKLEKDTVELENNYRQAGLEIDSLHQSLLQRAFSDELT